NRGTLVFLMGVTNLKKIASNLLLHGKSSSTPVALISWGCYERQRTLCTDLKNIAKRAEQENIKPPAVIVIGEVVRLSEKLGSKKTKGSSHCR
ncbi:MAG: uroporphyrinogen-III C-methyltransferase, partial [Desulfobacterales bacterium]